MRSVFRWEAIVQLIITFIILAIGISFLHTVFIKYQDKNALYLTTGLSLICLIALVSELYNKWITWELEEDGFYVHRFLGKRSQAKIPYQDIISAGASQTSREIPRTGTYERRRKLAVVLKNGNEYEFDDHTYANFNDLRSFFIERIGTQTP